MEGTKGYESTHKRLVEMRLLGTGREQAVG